MTARSGEGEPDGDALQARFLAAQAVAREAGLLARRMLADRGNLHIEMKGPQDFVSNADRAVERLIVQRLSAAFPSDTFLGEEGQGDKKAEAGAALWVIDPIDGTANFVRDRAEWCVSIGFLHSGQPAIGVIYHPVADELYAARAGHGATRNGVPIAVSRRNAIADATVALEYSARTPRSIHLALIDALMAEGGEYTRSGSAAVSLAHVADGRLDGFSEQHLYAWDVMAAIVLVAEAGGWVSDFLGNGGLQRGNPFVATALGIREQLTKLVNSSHARMALTLRQAGRGRDDA
jgi:myo-inositol-1(or 4)-monophosphatase